MKLLLDENIAPTLVGHLQEIGIETRHISKIGFSSISDISIFEIAEKSEEIIITHDLDFSSIHAFSGKSKPSVIQIRLQKISVDILKEILKEIITNFIEELENGVMITVDKNGLRFKELPIIKTKN